MSEQTLSRAPQRAPWLSAAVLAVVVAVLALLLVHTLAVRHDARYTVGSRFAPTAEQQQAVQAGATEAANLTTYSRAHFAADFARALAGATGKLRSDLAARRSTTLSAMDSGKFDLRSSVVESAFESGDGGSVTMLVTLNGTHVVDGKPDSIATPQRLELTMVKAGGKWLASNLVSVGIQ